MVRSQATILQNEFKIILLKLLLHLPGANGLNPSSAGPVDIWDPNFVMTEPSDALARNGHQHARYKQLS